MKTCGQCKLFRINCPSPVKHDQDSPACNAWLVNWFDSDGHRYRASWHQPLVLVRKDYKRLYIQIRTGAELRSTLRAGEYAWPCGYPMHLVNSNGESLHFDCVKKELRRHISELRDSRRYSMMCNINYADASLYCDECNERIESAYAEDEANQDGSCVRCKFDGTETDDFPCRCCEGGTAFEPK